MGFQPAGVKEFIKLDDTPESYTGQSDKAVKVKTGADGLEFGTAVGAIKVRKNYQMPVIGTRPQLNFVEGAAIDISILDNPPDDEIDIIIGSKVPTRFMTLFPDDAILPAANAPEKATVPGANFSYDVLDFDQATEESCFWERFLTPDYDAENIVLDIYWIATPAGGDVKWGVSVLGREKGETWDSALGTEQTVVTTTQGAGLLNKSRITTFSPNWAGGDMVMFKLARKAADALDTLAADARVIKVVPSYTGQFAQSFYPLPATLLTKPGTGSWGDIDVSDYVPVGATGVILKIVNDHGSNVDCGLRKRGSTDNRNDRAIQYSGIRWAYVGLDETRQFQIYWTDAAPEDFKVYLVAYTGTGVVFFDNAYDVSIGATGVWTDVDVSAYCPSDAIAVLLEIELLGAGDCLNAFRKKGSTDDNRYQGNPYKGIMGNDMVSWVIVGLDSSQVFQQKISDLGCDSHLLGYITQGAVAKTNADHIDGVSSNIWELQDVSSECPSGIMAFVEICPFVKTYSAGVRKYGDTEDLDNFGTIILNTAVVAVDSLQRLEVRHGMVTPSVSFHVTGYAQWAGA